MIGINDIAFEVTLKEGFMENLAVVNQEKVVSAERPVCAQIIRSARKRMGLTQQEVAKVMNVSQSALSKVEHGILIPDLFQWYDFCQTTGIHELSCKFGFIDNGQNIVLKHNPREGSYQIPERYAHHRGEAVRNILPFLDFMKKKMGATAYRDYLKKVHMDEDYFVDYTNQVNMNFLMDMTGELINHAGLNAQTIKELTSAVRQPQFHGVLSQGYEKVKTSEKVVNLVVKNMEKYQLDTHYKILDQKTDSVDIAVAPNSHMRIFDYKNSQWGSFLCDYQKSWLSEVAHFENLQGMELKELECHYQGAPQCIYRMAG